MSTDQISADRLLRQRFEAHVEQLAAPVGWQLRLRGEDDSGWLLCDQSDKDSHLRVNPHAVEVRPLYTISQPLRDELYDAFCVASMLDDKCVPRGDALRAYSPVERVLLFAGQEQWQDISSAPRTGHNILLGGQGQESRIGFFDSALDSVWSVWPGRAHAWWATHWRSLPSPPDARWASQPTGLGKTQKPSEIDDQMLDAFCAGQRATEDLEISVVRLAKELRHARDLLRLRAERRATGDTEAM